MRWASLEVNSHNQIAAWVTFELEDIDAAFEELNTRYLAGEGGAHAHTWSVIAAAHAAFTRHELPATTPDWVNIDHRRGVAFARGDLIPYIRATWNLAPQIRSYIEAVHRLTHLGAVFIQVTRWNLARGLRRRVAGGRPHDGRRRPDQPLRGIRRARHRRRAGPLRRTHRPTRRLENAASRVDERFRACFAARDWDAMAEIWPKTFTATIIVGC